MKKVKRRSSFRIGEKFESVEQNKLKTELLDSDFWSSSDEEEFEPFHKSTTDLQKASNNLKSAKVIQTPPIQRRQFPLLPKGTKLKFMAKSFETTRNTFLFSNSSLENAFHYESPPKYI